MFKNKFITGTKKVLVIDSHKGSASSVPQNLHWSNSYIIAQALDADLIWSYEGVNDKIISGYEKIVFNHASHYSFVDLEWLLKNPDADLFYITNEYNLGEPRIIWTEAKRGRHYTVIANHPAGCSKVVKKYTKDWVIVNLNALIFQSPSLEVLKKPRVINKPIYYGSFRKNRSVYFKKYLNAVTVSTHSKNIDKFTELGVTPNFIPRLNWAKNDLSNFSHSLYIEDDVTHINYNHLANRFYEALNACIIPIFGEECVNTISLSGYGIPDEFIVTSDTNIRELCEMDEIRLLPHWLDMAQAEKDDTIQKIKNIIC